MFVSMNQRLATVSFDIFPQPVRAMMRDPKLLTNRDAVEKARLLVPASLMDKFDSTINQAHIALSNSNEKTFFICVFILAAATVITFFFR
jgi:hypothetical protein